VAKSFAENFTTKNLNEAKKYCTESTGKVFDMAVFWAEVFQLTQISNLILLETQLLETGHGCFLKTKTEKMSELDL